MSSPLPLRRGAPPRLPIWPGGKPKAYFVMGVVVIAVGIAVAVLGVLARPQQRSITPAQALPMGGVMVAVGLVLAVISHRSKQRQVKARAALDAWARASKFERTEPDVAAGTWKGVPLSLRVAYGTVRSRGDARAWLVEVGASSARGWVIVLDPLDDVTAIRERLTRLADAAVASSRALASPTKKRAES